MPFSEQTQKFLWDLSFNNERPWFQEHKATYEEVLNKPFRELAGKTFEIVDGRFPLENLEVHISRIYRDARRLFGRGPYKDHLWFSIRKRGRGEQGASSFFEINPRGYSFGMGYWAATASEMDEFRKTVDANPAAFERLAKDIEAMDEFTVGGDEYKRPKGDYGPSVNRWYNRRNIFVICERDCDGLLYGDSLHEYLADEFTKLMPMCKYLNQSGKSSYDI